MEISIITFNNWGSRHEINKDNRYVKRCSASQITLGKCEIKTIVEITSCLLEWSASKRQKIINVEKRKLLCTLAGNVNWWNHHTKQYGAFSNNENRTIMWWGFYFWNKFKKAKPYVENSTPVHSSIFTIVKMWNNLSVHQWISR